MARPPREGADPREPPGRRVGARAAELDLSEALAGLRQALPDAALRFVEGPDDLGSLAGIDVVWNAVEAPGGRPDREAHVAAALEWRGVPFTGAGSETLALCRRKDHTRAVLAAAGVARTRGWS